MEKIKQYFSDIINLIPNNLSESQSLIFYLTILAIIALWCFIDIIGYLGSAYLIKYVDIENRYPKFKKIINYFKNSNIVLIIIEIIFIVSILLGAIAICIILLYFK